MRRKGREAGDKLAFDVAALLNRNAVKQIGKIDGRTKRGDHVGEGDSRQQEAENQKRKIKARGSFKKQFHAQIGLRAYSALICLKRRQ